MTPENKTPPVQNAVIYCRVSSLKQVNDGDGLASQETRCREYAASRNYDVLEVFSDVISGSTLERPGMKAMLLFLQSNDAHEHAVVIDDHFTSGPRFGKPPTTTHENTRCGRQIGESFNGIWRRLGFCAGRKPSCICFRPPAKKEP
ncbi:recombinase family protein [Pelagimonas varians]